MESQKEISMNMRFYILISFLIIVSIFISYFNLKINTTIPNFENANYDNILKHINMLKKVKNHT